MENSNSAPTGCYKCGRTGHWSHDCPNAPKSDNPNPTRVERENARAGATGCYKCGRPGHWARDCPDGPKSDQPNPSASSSGANFAPNQLPRPEKPKKVPKSRSRPKLTPEILLSDDGLGFILRHFPRAFRYRGRGHEVGDLGNLIGIYKEWHKHLLPYYSFEQFVHKTDKVASSKRVKNCIRELRERVARGGDPTKLHEASDEPDNGPSDEQDTAGGKHSEEQTHDHHEGNLFDDIQEDMLNEIYHKSSEEPCHEARTDIVAAEVPTTGSFLAPEHQVQDNGISSSIKVPLTEEQSARMEANKMKALERAAAAGSSNAIQITEEQRARMEANKLKAMEKAAAARARSVQSA